jgi:single-stranded-DNA-specific exonuclease
MDKAASYLAEAIQSGKKIAVFGDFDVDGATSTAVLVRFLRHCGLDVPFYIPDRMVEGYGPNINALQKLKEQGADIVILADCGTTAFDVIEQAAAIGLETVILDHHEAEDKLPIARYVINPKRKDDTSGLTMLAACGVSFMTCVAVNAKLRQNGFFTNGRTEAPLKDWLDIVALGTVCDMVPLTGVNRLFVRTGFTLMARHANPGLKALCEVAGLKNAPTPYDAGFVIGPRINAGSRVHQANLGARLLCTDDAEEARNIAFTLEDCNAKRKTIQEDMLNQAVAMVEAQALHQQPVIIVGHQDWHPGLSGLVAGRLKEKYNKPSVVVTYTPGMQGTLEGRGSGRSVTGVNLGGAFIDARNAGLLLKGGGHAMAAGFTVLPDQLEAFSGFLRDHIGRQMQGMVVSCETPIDALLTVRGAQLDLARTVIDHIGPFGADQPEPVFAFANVRVHFAEVIGTDHVKCQIADWEGGSRIKAVAFRAADTDLGRALLKAGPSTPLHIAGTLKINSWQGRESVELHITDAALAAAMPTLNAAMG